MLGSSSVLIISVQVGTESRMVWGDKITIIRPASTRATSSTLGVIEDVLSIISRLEDVKVDVAVVIVPCSCHSDLIGNHLVVVDNIDHRHSISLIYVTLWQTTTLIIVFAVFDTECKKVRDNAGQRISKHNFEGVIFLKYLVGHLHHIETPQYRRRHFRGSEREETAQ